MSDRTYRADNKPAFLSVSARLLLPVLCLVALLLTCSGCTETEPPAPSVVLAAEPAPAMPICFDDEAKLMEVIHLAKSKDADQDVVTIPSAHYDIRQSYSIKLDQVNLAGLRMFYAPVKELPNTTLAYIEVSPDYVSYHYHQKDKEDSVNFTWFRVMTPMVAMNNLESYGKPVRRETINGNEYAFMELRNSAGVLENYGIFYAVNGKAYQVFVPATYTEEEILAFCEPRMVIPE